MKRWLIFCSFLVVWLWNLYGHKEVFKPSIGYYFWTTKCQVPKNFKYTPYIKILDISHHDRLSVIKTRCNYHDRFVGVIYLDNSALKKISLKRLSSIINSTLKSYHDIKVLQFDCDWSNSTRDKYFTLLKKFSNYNLEATIRLHQVKFFKKTGVPPVKRGILMFYNMSDFQNPKTKNYILDLEVAKQYMKNFDKYPLKLDVALPNYSQATIIRNNKVVGLIEGVTKTSLDRYFLHQKANRYLITKTHYFKGRVLYKGDMIRVDEVTPIMIEKSLKLLKKYIKNPIKRVVFYRYGKKKKRGQGLSFGCITSTGKIYNYFVR